MNRPKCKKCNREMQKNGPRNGKQRWRCPVACKHSSFTEGKCIISKQKQQSINFLYNFISTIDDKNGDEIIKTNDNLSQTSIKCKEDKIIEVTKIMINKKEENIEIPTISYIVYKEEDTLKMIAIRYVEEKDFRRKNKRFSVVIRDPNK